ncbi:serine/threonine protein kinase [Prauserella marina]|uniref:non-specific serine/threonine protein kinase n=1 Tax=Prauserella marina TaxID=530584 RepID=A0A222VK09_9PSEU|nr:serine/threonine-protein kinase [Prauserella marina]ASR34162.1 serine/threonine protein kinase [Prauserella marina]PWV82812.1 serine/threonine protein kinase [Prauserella marina]SDC77871.1 Serine/threonine protein kinase [Prauserella marina]
MNDTEGALVGERYRLDQPIGRGRAGIVWLAFDTMLHRTVAAKRLLVQAGPGGADQAREATLREGQQAMRVVHANAIAVYDVFHDGGNDDVWLVMEYVPSRNMADFLSEHGQLTPEQAAYLGVQLGSALAAAHEIGVSHRVVEPRNVLLADDGGVKITDIGISDATPDPAFQAPEVAAGEPASPASDAFSLGATLFTAVEGTPPFGSDGTGPPSVPNRSGTLTGAVLKLLRADPELRPTMNDTIIALKAITRGQQAGFVPPTAPAMPTVPVMPRPPRVQPRAAQAPGTASRMARPKTLRWALVVLAALVVVAVGVAVVV